MTFDGALARNGDLWCAGAAAVARGPRQTSGRRVVLAAWSVALPDVDTASPAEAWGARLAIDLLLTVRQRVTHHGPPAIGGDNGPIVRLCLGTGRTASPSTNAIVADSLNRLASEGLMPRWIIIPRTCNDRAHNLARAAARAAVQRHRAHTLTPHVWDTSTEAQNL